MNNSYSRCMVLAVVAGIAAGCSSDDSVHSADISDARPPIVASNAFYYYEDVLGAESFYNEIFGLETVSDFGFAKILQVAPTSFLTLVDADSGMHSADEPKTVTLALVTDHVEDWYEHLTRAGVPMRSEMRVEDGRPHDGFVAIDPEGYLLEVERFNPHQENETLVPVLAEIEPLVPSVGDGKLTISATVLWLYFEELQPIQSFYENALGLDLIVDQGWAKVYTASPTGFVGFVDGTRGLHNATEENGVTVSFLTDDIESWFDHMSAQDGFEFRTEELGDESGRVRTFVGYDPSGYFLEWDEFLDRPGNEELLQTLRKKRRGQ